MSDYQKDLILALKHGLSAETLNFIISKVKDVNFGTSWKNPLLYVCHEDYFNPDLIKKFVEMGADLEIRSHIGSTPIMFCAEMGAIELTKFLYEKGADPCVKNYKGWDLLYSARLSKNQEMIKLAEELIKKGKKTACIKNIEVKKVDEYNIKSDEHSAQEDRAQEDRAQEDRNNKNEKYNITKEQRRRWREQKNVVLVDTNNN